MRNIAIKDTNNVNGVDNITNIHIRSFTKEGYTIIKISKEKQLLDGKNVSFNVNIESLSVIIFTLVSVVAVIFSVRHVALNRRIVSLKVKTRSYLIDDSHNSNDKFYNTNESTRKQKDNELYILAKSLFGYTNSLLKQFFRTLCGIGIKTIVLLEEYPSRETNKIMDLIKDSELEECVQLKYIGSNTNLKMINSMKVNEILEMLNVLSSTKKNVLTSKVSNAIPSKKVIREYNINKQRVSIKDKHVIVYGRRNRYFIQKELYEALKQGISLEELRNKYNDRIHNLIMDMYNDGIIISSNGKMFLID